MESLWKPVIKRLDQRLCDFKLPRNLSGKNFFSFSVVFFVGLFVCLFVCLFLCVDAFFCCSSGLLKITSLCYPSWLANAFLNLRKCFAKYSDSRSNVIYFFFFFLERKLIAIFLSFKLVDWLETSSFHSNLRNFMKVSGSMAKSGIQ